MRQKSGTGKALAEQVIKDIRRATRKQYGAEEKIRVVLEGMRGEDLTAVVAVFPEGDGEARRYDVLPMFFLPEANIATKSEKDRADDVRWGPDGFLTLTPGNVVDHSAIVDHVIALG